MFSITSNPLQQNLLLAVVAIRVFLNGLDGSIVMNILSQITESFGNDTGTVSWVIITCLLMMIAGLILILGSCVFALGSTACGISPDFDTLLVSQVFQGIDTAGKGIVEFSDLDPGIFMQGFHVSMIVGLVLSVIALVLSMIVRKKMIFSAIEKNNRRKTVYEI